MAGPNFNVTDNKAANEDGSTPAGAGGGGAGDGAGVSAITRDTIASDVLITSLSPTYEDTGHSVTFTTGADEYVLMNVQFHLSTGVVGSCRIRYDLDGTTQEELAFVACADSTSERYSQSLVIGPLTAGSHTIHLEASKGNTNNVTIYGTNDTVPGRAENYLEIVQFGASTGALKELLDWTPAASTSTTSATLVDITSVANQSIAVPKDGDYLFTVHANGLFQNNTGRTEWELAVIVDDTTTYAFPQFSIAVSDTAERKLASASVKIPLTGGSRNVRLQWRRVAGPATIFVDGESRLQLTIV